MVQRGLSSWLAIASVFAVACGGDDRSFDPEVLPADGILVGARGSPTHGPWPRLIGELENPGPALEFEFEGKRYRPNAFWRARQVGEELLVCAKVFELPSLEARSACYRMQPNCEVHAEFVAEFVNEPAGEQVHYLPTSQGSWLRRRRGGSKDGWARREGADWKALSLPGSLTELDEGPGLWFGRRDPHPETQIVAFDRQGVRAGSLSFPARATMMPAPTLDAALVTTGGQALVWTPGKEPLDLSTASAPQDGSPESFHGATWGFGHYADELVLWSSRELGMRTTSVTGAKNPAFQPFRIDPRSGQARRAASFASQPYEPLWISRALGECLAAPT